MAGHRRRRGKLPTHQRRLVNRLEKAAHCLAASHEPTERISAAADLLRSVVKNLPVAEADATADRAVTALLDCLPSELAAPLAARVQTLTADLRGPQ
jgi:hypothetical protein